MYKFPKEKKLLKSNEFRRVLDSGKKFILPELVLFSEKNALETNRMGLVVTKKIGNAVIRNRIKRQLREVFRKASCHQEEGQDKLDLVFIARSKAKTVSFDKLSKSFEFAMKHVAKKHGAQKKEAKSS